MKPSKEGRSGGSVGIVVQARLGSTRLLRKALLPLGGSTLLEMVLARLALVHADHHVLATDHESAGPFAALAERHGFEVLAGPSEDVLGRYCLAIRQFGLDRIIRVTGDNPLICHEAIGSLLRDHRNSTCDYVSYEGMPVGMGVELLAASALLRAGEEAVDPYEREHVSPHLYNNPTRYAIDRPRAPDPWYLPQGRVTVDIAEDYEAVLRLYGAFYDGRPIASLRVMEALRTGLPASGEPVPDRSQT